MPTSKKTPPSGVKKVIASAWFGRMYAAGALAILFGTVLLWSILSARIHVGNADNLVDAYFFQYANTFRGALFPNSHTFLLKWPLFLFIKVFGYSSATFIAFTVAVVLLTVGFLVYYLYKMDKRPLVFGTLCLALASVLLLVPAQPYAGAILPVNMAMLATRNLEYVLYIVALTILVRSPRIRSSKFWVAVGLLALLIASDKLFMSLSIGAALGAFIMYAMVRRWSLVTMSVNWLLASLFAVAGAFGILWILNGHGITHIVGSANLSGPYGAAHGLHSLVLGGIFGILGLLTNFGANPAFDATVLHDIPHQLASRLFTVSGPIYILNLLIVVAGVAVVCHLFVTSLKLPDNSKSHLNTPARLALVLAWSTLAAFAVFVVSNHYYAVDARYLTIAVFTIFIALAAFTSRLQWRPKVLVIFGGVVVACIALGIPAVVKNYRAENAVMSVVNQRNTDIAKVLENHKVDFLVGDYWRVVPTRLASGNKINVMPLADCTTPRDVLSSKNWQSDVKGHKFAYLLTFDMALTDFPHCQLEQVTNIYGRPNASVVVAGTVAQPKELILFYDHGIANSSPVTPSKAPATVVPIALSDLPNVACTGPTDINVVAHEDDDLLFLSPDLANNLSAGHCIRTIYLTTGDAGYGEFYWLNREAGSEAAYSMMLGTPNDVWIQRVVQLPDGQYVTVANPRGNSKISLVFMHLPDGDLGGNGFKDTHYESLAKLRAGQIKAIHSVYSQSTYTSQQLTDGLEALMHIYQPTNISTQASLVNTTYPDHSDHMNTGYYTTQARNEYNRIQYENQVAIPIHYYVGYPVHGMPQNVNGQTLANKEAVFLTYAKHDLSVCHNIQQCVHTPTYEAYLSRQYQNPY